MAIAPATCPRCSLHLGRACRPAGPAAEAAESYRLFPDDDLMLAYRFPLPRGSYRVALHFAETRFEKPGVRRFAVVIEGQEVLGDYEPGSVGFATADKQTFEAQVNDGMLDIEFVPQTYSPAVHAIELLRIE